MALPPQPDALAAVERAARGRDARSRGSAQDETSMYLLVGKLMSATMEIGTTYGQWMRGPWMPCNRRSRKNDRHEREVPQARGDGKRPVTDKEIAELGGGT
jgi:hypothetical protein